MPPLALCAGMATKCVIAMANMRNLMEGGESVRHPRLFASRESVKEKKYPPVYPLYVLIKFSSGCWLSAGVYNCCVHAGNL